ncbi:MAG: acetate kinase, partial [Ramlibacter sp.]|nr:acetate kinase [Ramlibacter sp.]
SVATTLGFSALDGLMMGSRCGALDPGAVIYLMEIEKLSLEQVGHMLYHESGLRGISGVSDDTQVLLPLEDSNPQVRIALQLYVRRMAKEIAAMATAMQGIDLLVFTAGVGENNAVIRERVCAELGWLGARLDADANQQNAAIISAPDSAFTIAIEATNEEWVAAQHAWELIGLGWR